MNFFRSKPKSIVGIDIGSHAIKVVELAGSAANPRVTAWGSAPLPKGAFNDDTIANAEAIADTIQGLLVQSNVTAKAASVAVSSSHAITKVLSMPKQLSDVEMEEQISVEALHFIPYPIDEVNLDFEIMGESEVNNEENDVLLVACRRSVVDDYIDLIEELELGLQYVDIDTYALERVYRSQHTMTPNSNEVVGIFDIGATSSHLMVVDPEKVAYSRHQSFGAAQFIKLIRKEYGVSADEAEEILRSSQPPGDFVSAVQEPFVEILSQEVNRALQFFYSSSSHSNIDSLVITGGCVALSGLAEDLETSLRTKVRRLDPLANALVQSDRQRIDKARNSLSIAYGLSLRGLS